VPCVEGEVHGTLHREVWEQYGGQLQPGSVLVLRQVGVLSTGLTARRHYLNVTCNNLINIYSNVLQDETAGQRSCEVRTTRVHRVTRAELLKTISDWQACHSSAETAPDCKPVDSMFSTIGIPANLSVPCHALNVNGSVTGHLKSPLSSLADGWQQSVVSVPKLVCGIKVPQASGGMLCNSVNRRDNTKSGHSLNDNVQIGETDLCSSAAVNTSTPFNRRVTAVTAQSVHGKTASSGLNLSDMPQQIKKNESFKFQPLMAHASGRRNVLDSLHQSEEGKISGIKGFKFLPQPALPVMSDRTDMVAPKYEGGFTPRVLHFGSSSPSVSQASNPSQVSAVPSTSFDVLDWNRTSKPTATVAKPLQQTPTQGGSAVSTTSIVPRSIECLTQVESSALEVLEGLDTSSLFDDF
jgi:hypothetical protein